MKIVVFHTIVGAFVRIPCEIQPDFTNDISRAHDFKSVRRAKQFVKENQLTCLVVFRVVDLTK